MCASFVSPFSSSNDDAGPGHKCLKLNTVLSSTAGYWWTLYLVIICHILPCEMALNHRLPRHVVPSHYKLHLQPDLTNATFNGSVDISINITQSTDTIILNALELNVTEAIIDRDDISIVDMIFNEEDETLTLKLNASATPGPANLSFNFIGTLNDKLKGFYRSKYTSDVTDYAAVTQFQANGARMCFPCWDEPDFKATFIISITVPNEILVEKMRVLSNMPLESREAKGDTTTFFFMETPKMSTYLVAFIVGKFDSVSGYSPDGRTEISVYTPVNRGAEGSFALEATGKLLKFYTNYFNVSFPLPKLDLVSVPEMSFSGMENWGLITFREYAILTSDDSSAASQWLIAEVIAHEVAHMWFGDLVTIAWWSHLWLNEGFATYMSYLSIDTLYPQFTPMKKFVTECYSPALKLDALENSHPIEVPVSSARDVSEIFDDISYKKGASVIGMCASYIGKKAFRDGVSSYLDAFKYSNTETPDLWKHLSEKAPRSQIPLQDVMRTWTEQKGFPLIKVDVEANGANKSVTVCQSKFRAASATGDSGYKWHVPITIVTSKSPQEPVKAFLLSNTSASVTIDGLDDGDWIKLNAASVGIYRVQYSSEYLKLLARAIERKELTSIDRLSIFSDLSALVLTGNTSAVDLLDLLPSFVDEDDSTVWSAIFSTVAKLSQLMFSSSEKDKWSSWAGKIFESIYKRTGWDEKPSDTPDDKLLRASVISSLASLGNNEVRDKCRDLFNRHVKKIREIPVNMRSVVFSIAASDIIDDSKDSQTIYDNFITLYNETNLIEEKNRILTALVSMHSDVMVRKLLDFVLTPQVRSEGLVIVLSSLASNPSMRMLAWRFFKDNAPLIKSRYEGGFQVTRLITSITSNLDKRESIDDIKSFFSNFTIAGTAKTVQQCLEYVQINVDWIDKQLPLVEKYLHGK